MTPQEFIAALEQQQQLVKQAAPGLGRALVPKVIKIPGRQAVEKAAPGLFQRGLNAAGRGAAIAADEGLTALDNLGRVTRHYGGKAVDSARDFVEGFRGKGDVPAGSGAPRLVQKNTTEKGLVPYTGPGTAVRPYRGQLKEYTPPGRTWGNIGTGAGVAGAATAGLTAINPWRGGRDGDGETQTRAPNYSPMNAPALNPSGGGLMEMWNSLPLEARYAIGAGVPLALMGAFAHGNGNSGLGMGMGAAGLGLAGLGAAHGGLFGRNMQQGAQGIMSALTGRGSDPHYNAYLQGQLQQNLANNSVRPKSAAAEFGEKISRCWEGYEPVPGSKAYTEGSCRPKGSKKTQKEMKKKAGSVGCGQTSMPMTASSRGTTKLVSDKQKETTSPQPTDAENAPQESKEAAIGFARAMMPQVAKRTAQQATQQAAPGLLQRGMRAAGQGAAGLAAGSRAAVTGVGKAVSGVGDMATQLGNSLNRSGQVANLMTGGGGVRRTAGAALSGVGNLATAAGNVTQGLGRYSATAVPLAAMGANYAYQNVAKPYTQPYTNAAQQFGANVVNNVSQGANNLSRGLQNMRSGVADYAGTAFGAGVNAVSNTARDVRRGVNQAVDTAKSYIPQVRNPFYFQPQQPQPWQTAQL